MHPQEPAAKKFTGVKFILRALRSRNYRLFFAGQGISLIGSWMQIVAMSWLVYRLTNSAFLLGVIGFTSQVPAFIFGPFAGVVADRGNRRAILVLTQSLSMLQALLLAFLTFSGAIAVWHIIALSIFIGLVVPFDMTIRQAFVVDIVESREDLSNAIALNSLLFNSSRLIGAALAGMLIAWAGEGVCFLLNGLSFLAVIFALSAMKLKPFKSPARKYPILPELKEGLAYTFGFAPIKYVLLLVTLISLLGTSYMVLMPVFARDVLAGNAGTLGFLMAATGLGALAGGIYLAGRENVLGLEKILFTAPIVFGIGLIAFSLSSFLWLSLLIMLCVGFGIMVQLAACNTILQSLTSDDKRGRVMSFYTMALIGVVPFGSLLSGSVADRLGAPVTLFASGCLCILVVLFLSGKFKFIKLALAESRKNP
jgi:MFS family permease